jgi:hypothetical protein
MCGTNNSKISSHSSSTLDTIAEYDMPNGRWGDIVKVGDYIVGSNEGYITSDTSICVLTPFSLDLVNLINPGLPHERLLAINDKYVAAAGGRSLAVYEVPTLRLVDRIRVDTYAPGYTHLEMVKRINYYF